MIPVVCTASLKPEVTLQDTLRDKSRSSLTRYCQLINDFLTETYEGYPEAAQSLVILTTTDWQHYSNDESQLSPEEARKQKSKVLTHGGGPMKVPSRPSWTEEFEPPFLGQSPEEVARVLREANDAPGHLDRRFCAILDEESVKKRDVLLVKTKRSESDKLPEGCEEWEIVKVRETWKEANAVLQSASVGVSSLEEILWNQRQKQKQ